MLRGSELLDECALVRSPCGALPAVHELAEQAGIDLPPALGRLHDHGLARADGAAGNGAPEIEEDSAAVVPPPMYGDQETV